MIKRIVVRFEQAIMYGFINLILFLRISNKIYLPGYSIPINVRPKSSDLLTFHQVFTFKEYDINFGFIPKIIIDAGANIGLAAVYFNRKYPNAKIIAIEPEKSNFEILKMNCKHYKNIYLHKRALSSQSNLTLNVIDKGYGNWGFVTEIDSDESFENIVDTVITITIDEILNENSLEYIDLLKIDIEGGEKLLFESNYENWIPKTKCIVIELHDGIKMGSSNSFFKAISRFNFSYHNRGENLVFMNRDIL
ncbi:FkbM family methyltransferase [Flavobacterium sp.]|jgi:FkbM family methyltransferase|uniref:FkbM family methyltransferase n=1 Tax=Flavobacterium sp. TaxID=239 RepID=UPI0037C15BD3